MEAPWVPGALPASRLSLSRSSRVPDGPAPAVEGRGCPWAARRGQRQAGGAGPHRLSHHRYLVCRPPQSLTLPLPPHPAQRTAHCAHTSERQVQGPGWERALYTCRGGHPWTPRDGTHSEGWGGRRSLGTRKLTPLPGLTELFSASGKPVLGTETSPAGEPARAGPRAVGVFGVPDHCLPLALLAPPTRRRQAPTPSTDTESVSGQAVRPCVKTWASLSSRCRPPTTFCPPTLQQPFHRAPHLPRRPPSLPFLGPSATSCPAVLTPGAPSLASFLPPPAP